MSDALVNIQACNGARIKVNMAVNRNFVHITVAHKLVKRMLAGRWVDMLVEIHGKARKSAWPLGHNQWLEL